MPDYFGELIYVAAFVLFVVFAIIRRIAEARNVGPRDEREVSVEELPEETRRMLFGDEPPTARPATPKRSFDPFEEIRELVQDVQRQMEPRTAKPKQSAPPPPPQMPPVRPEPVRAQPVSQQPHAPMRPAPPARAPQVPPIRSQPTPRTPAPPRHAPQPQQPRMVAPQGMAQRAAQPAQRQPVQRGQRPPTARRAMVEPQEGPQTPFPMPSAKRAAPPTPGKKRRWIGSKEDLRRAVVLMEILGPPKSLQ